MHVPEHHGAVQAIGAPPEQQGGAGGRHVEGGGEGGGGQGGLVWGGGGGRIFWIREGYYINTKLYLFREHKYVNTFKTLFLFIKRNTKKEVDEVFLPGSVHFFVCGAIFM